MAFAEFCSEAFDLPLRGDTTMQVVRSELGSRVFYFFFGKAIEIRELLDGAVKPAYPTPSYFSLSCQREVRKMRSTSREFAWRAAEGRNEIRVAIIR